MTTRFGYHRCYIPACRTLHRILWRLEGHRWRTIRFHYAAVRLTSERTP